MAGPAGFEPTMRESKSLALPLGYGPSSYWGGRWESNPPMSGPQPDALTASPRPPNLSAITIIHDFHVM